MGIAISSGHGLHVPGAHTVLGSEVLQARRVTQDVCRLLRLKGISMFEFHDDVSRNQNDNLNRIIDWHNSLERDLDVSIHFNAIAGITANGIGVEVLFRNDAERELAAHTSALISYHGQFRNRGAVRRDNLRVLNMVNRPCVLIEVCFINSETDMRLYRQNYDAICEGIALALVKERGE